MGHSNFAGGAVVISIVVSLFRSERGCPGHTSSVELLSVSISPGWCVWSSLLPLSSSCSPLVRYHESYVPLPDRTQGCIVFPCYEFETTSVNISFVKCPG